MTKRRIPIRDLILLKMNPVVKYLIISDVIYASSVGLLGPIFAIFVTDFVSGGNATVAGVAAAIFLITKSVAQIPIGAFIDKVCGDVDDYWFMFGGAIVYAIVPLAYLFISSPGELYLIQFTLGLASAFTFPSYMALFTRYIDKDREATTWSVYYMLTDMGSAAAAAIGGVLATTIGFEKVIIAVVIIGAISVLLYIPIRPALRKTKPC